MKTDTSQKIIELLKKQGQVTVKDMVDHLGISRQAMFKQLNRLKEKGAIYKIGLPPTVFYLLKQKEELYNADPTLNKTLLKQINQHFMIITPLGERKEGIEGFAYWCQKTKQPLQKTANEYVKTLKKYHAFKKGGFINGKRKIQSSFDQAYLNQLFYLDFYSIERFGKTKLGQMLLYAKQSQNKVLTKELIADIKPSIQTLIQRYKADAVGFIPPTVKRETQFMKVLERQLDITLPKIDLVKVKTEVVIPQKTLSKLPDRIENAQKTIVATEKSQYNTVLLIDDAVGSGATLNETAKQLKQKKIAKKVIGLAITGSFKGFEVISEV